MSTKNKYIAFLRGINVGGHHKVPMADLKKQFAELGFENSITVLNTGNILFDAPKTNQEQLEQQIALQLANHFGFPIPTIIREAKTMQNLVEDNPFKTIEQTKAIQFYISLLKKDGSPKVDLPWESADGAFKIIAKKGKNIFSVLDRSISKTPKAMKALEEFYDKDITTRNWNTILRVGKKLGGV